MPETPIRLLIVEDEEMLRNSLRDHFEDEGFEVHAAASGEDGLALLQDIEVDLCLADMRLPGMDGNEFILAAHARDPRLAFLVHTGSVDYALPRALREIGLHREHVFQKPILDMGILTEAVRQALSHKNG